ncbi:MAG: phosphohistidine phosphatase [Rhodospirillaceae bacterium]|nr:MAG: phosphohistidine phosphatase [Rhodospirillaceae bacterium]
MTGVKNILLLRHAKSAWNIPHQSDHDRPLNDRGERAARTIAAHMAAKAPRPDLILCSTAARTRQTLAPLVKALGSPTPPISLEKQLYLASESELLERLQALPENVETVLLIGHNEGIGEFAVALAGQGTADALQRLREKYPTGALATLAVRQGPWSALAPGACELVAFVRPRDLDPR